MQRRDFLKQVAAWSAGAALSAPIFRLGPAALGGTLDSSSILSVAKGQDYEALVGMVLKPLGGMGAFVKKGDKVVVKPNMGWDRKPELAANTHPLVIKATVRAALDAGASQVLVFDHCCNDARACYAHSGIQEAVRSIGDQRATCELLDNRKWMPVQIARGKKVKQWTLYKDAVEADCYINVPIAKHHGLAKLTLGMKNAMGVMGGNRGQIHQSIGQSLADINTVLPIKLTIIDATRILLRGGPTGGNPADVKVLDTLIASADPVAADAYATTLFGMEPRQISSTVAAFEMGMGQMDLSKVKIVSA